MRTTPDPVFSVGRRDTHYRDMEDQRIDLEMTEKMRLSKTPIRLWRKKAACHCSISFSFSITLSKCHSQHSHICLICCLRALCMGVNAYIIHQHLLRELSGHIRIFRPLSTHREVEQNEERMIENPALGVGDAVRRLSL